MTGVVRSDHRKINSISTCLDFRNKVYDVIVVIPDRIGKRGEPHLMYATVEVDSCTYQIVHHLKSQVTGGTTPHEFVVFSQGMAQTRRVTIECSLHLWRKPR